MRSTRVISVRVKTPLYERINTLAKKRLMTMNAYCTRLLEQHAKPR